MWSCLIPSTLSFTWTHCVQCVVETAGKSSAVGDVRMCFKGYLLNILFTRNCEQRAEKYKGDFLTRHCESGFPLCW